MLKTTNLLNNNAPGFRFGLGNENLPGLGRENLAHLCSVDEAGQLRRKHPLSAPLWSGNQISVRQPILFMGPPQISQRRSARKSHLDVRRLMFDVVCQRWKTRRNYFPNFPLDP